MKRTVIITAGLLLTTGTALAQNDSSPPVITNVTWEVSRYAGGEGFSEYYNAYVPFDTLADTTYERDWLRATISVTDTDFAESGEEDSEGVYYLVQSDWIPVNGYPSPEPPPVAEDLTAFFPEEDGLSPTNGTVLTIVHEFQVPPFAGKNQARLRGLIDYDVLWQIRIMVSNDQDPRCTEYLGETLDLPCEDVVDIWYDVVYALESPMLGGANPPPFADAGPDQTVEAGTVTLDGSLSIDLYNSGFDVESNNVFDKDDLTYTWEWISGPQKVDPVQAHINDPTATINLVVPGTYVYRLTVDDNVNAVPSSDLVTIVVTTLEANVAPKARIKADPIGKQTWVVGETITLSAEDSSDSNADDELEYMWRQTDELGGVIPADSLLNVFQPLSGMDEAEASWQALAEGSYYFRLLVSDGELTDVATFTVEVIDTEAAGASVGGGDQEGTSLLGPLGSSGACGAGIMPFALAPLAFCALRRRGK